MHDVTPGTTRALGVRTRRVVAALFIGFVVVPLVTVAISSTFLFRPGGRVLEIEMRATGGNVAQVFWSASYAFNGLDSGIELLHQHPGGFDRVRFPLPDRPLELVRFDPMNGGGEVVVRSMRVLNYQGETMRTIDPLILAPLHQIARMTPTSEGVRVVTTPGADDPMLIMWSSWLVATSPWHSLRFVTPLSLAWIAAAVLALIVAAIAFLARDIARTGSLKWRDAAWLAALFLAVVWAKAALLQHYPVPVPFWDQWDGEGASLYIPWAHDGLSWRQMFRLHNEHRIFFSRVLAMTLLGVNGQWDSHLQILVNAVLHSVAAVVFAIVIWLATGRRWLPLVAGMIGLVSAPPFALENSLAGFQSAFYFLLLFSALALWLMGIHRPGTPAWWLGWLCAFCCPFTVAGGTFIVAPIGCVAVLKTIARPREWRQAVVNLIALAAIVAVAYAGLPPPIPSHEALKAASLHAFWVSLAHNVAFPWIKVARASAIVWLPLLVLSAIVVFRRLRTTAFEQVTFALASWVILQAAAIAYSRGVGGVAPTSRYLDMLSFGFVVNTLAVLAWLDQPSRWRRIVAAVVVAGWFIAGAIGIAGLSQDMLATGAHQRRQWAQEHVRTVRQFVATGNPKDMLDMRGPQEVPHHSPWMLANWLQHPYVRRILPAIVRTPLQIRSREDDADGFSLGWSAADGEILPVFDSYARDRARGQGRFESEPLACTEFRHLRFEVAGAARDSGLRLSLRDVQSGREIPVRPSPGSRSGWTGAFARCPDGPFTVVAVDDSPISWFAFRLPAETAWPSAIAERIVQQADALGFAAFGLAALALGWEIRAQTSARASS